MQFNRELFFKTKNGEKRDFGVIGSGGVVYAGHLLQPALSLCKTCLPFGLAELHVGLRFCFKKNK